jgi:hypothetical protein
VRHVSDKNPKQLLNNVRCRWIDAIFVSILFALLTGCGSSPSTTAPNTPTISPTRAAQRLVLATTTSTRTPDCLTISCQILSGAITPR